MEKYNFYANIDSNIANEAKRYPLHLRGNHLATICKQHALEILESSGFNELTNPLELFVLTSKLRSMLRFAMATKRYDYDSISPARDDEEKGSEMYRALDRVIKAVSRVYMTGDLPSGEHISDDLRIDFCKSLLWLIAMGLNTNSDLYDDYFGFKPKKL